MLKFNRIFDCVSLIELSFEYKINIEFFSKLQKCMSYLNQDANFKLKKQTDSSTTNGILLVLIPELSLFDNTLYSILCVNQLKFENYNCTFSYEEILHMASISHHGQK